MIMNNTCVTCGKYLTSHDMTYGHQCKPMDMNNTLSQGEQGERINISVVQYGDIWACEFTIGVQTFTVCERDNKEVADAYAKNLKFAFNNAALRTSLSAPKGQQEPGEEGKENFDERSGVYVYDLQQRILEQEQQINSLKEQVKEKDAELSKAKELSFDWYQLKERVKQLESQTAEQGAEQPPTPSKL